MRLRIGLLAHIFPFICPFFCLLRLIFFYFDPFFFLSLYYMLTLKIYVGVFSGTFKVRMLKLGIHMDNELLYYRVEIQTLCSYSSVYLSIFYPVSFVFVCRPLRICVTVFFATYLLLLIYSSALLKQCSGAIVRFSDSSSYSYFLRKTYFMIHH